MLSLQKNPSNVKKICYLEVTAKNSTAIKDGDEQLYQDGVWSIGTELDPLITKLDSVTLNEFEVEKLKGPLLYTGVKIDNYAGFEFQVARYNIDLSYLEATLRNTMIKTLSENCFYEDCSRLTSADGTYFNYFKSNKKDQTGYKENTHYSIHVVRNLSGSWP